MSDFMLPDIGEGIVECEVVEWRVAEGDVIEEDQPVVEVMTDKALVEITAPEAGRITRLHVPQGEIAKVHAPLFAYEAEGADATETAAAGGAPAEEASAPAASTAAASTAASSTPDSASASRGRATKDFILPDIGEGIVECEVVEWRIQEGETIAEDQPVVDVMTDKALVEITAPEAGVMSRLHVAQGEIARVHAPLYAYTPEAGVGEEEESGAAAEQPSTPAATAERAPEREASSGGPEGVRGQGPYGRIPAAPAVRRLLREHDLSLEAVPGSGKQGRVLKEDVLNYLEQGGLEQGAASASGEKGTAASRATAPASAAPSTPSQGEVRVEPLRGVRAVMARRMVESASTIPHFQYGEEIDVTALLALRERLKPLAQAEGARLTLMPFFMKAMALAVREAPILNARLNDDVSEIHYLPSVNVGMAVDSRTGLLVPNVKGVERRSLLEVAAEVQRLTEAARSGKVAQEDLRNGTISISNIGALGGTYAAPIINAPELAIVAIGKTQWLPRFDAEDRVVKRAIMTVTWAGDHRVIDGGTIARFCNAWKGYLEEPESMLLHLS
ncbi:MULTISPECIES: dihydrolipoyllysine-residue acetyltransferase [unclassified Halomonas]|uniref:dihydrolipoyllysine-residue acetyltransferase n=1 Tax=unclassified Halomonas TaxID=2609666 RepID=UPI0028838968|nr:MULTISPECIES: dihydrolipoyllysine-residue acetyltransferase [unclassified Halomonas]MDT0500439.1 dihydrolipoyllysine-residue acetyltransferase [Halomonas sp. PAR7]MDT0511664.1 dihydrolipoyllysine-residue acetyltransferase [Halomonas sp. LES1]MDT0590048.1 dihydrolipoyllysine-residue acetyltransferase [Halomonas sp. PAR8]